MEPIQEPQTKIRNSSSALNIPTAIIIAGAIIAIALIYTKGPATIKPAIKNSPEQQMRPVTAADHILGNPNAKVKIVEYSDPSCPFCKVFHNTMRKVMTDYGTTGNLAWVYRNFPLDKPDANGNVLHKNAAKESQAFECAASLGGNEKFWTYTNRLYEITPAVTGSTPNGLDPKELPNIAKFAGLNVDDFNNCLATGKFKEKVDADFLDGVNIGISGTPTSIIVLSKAFPDSIKEKLMQIYEPYKSNNGEYPIRLSNDSKMIVLGGAMPLDIMKATIDLMFTY
jgi:protein-disulfide isomerase